MHKLKDIGIILFFMLLFSYTCIILFHGVHPSEQESPYESTLTIIRSDMTGTEAIPLEEYLIGMTAANIPTAYEDETIKAQIVILRTAIMRIGMIQQEREIAEEKIGQEYMNISQMQLLWGNEFPANYNRIKELVKETERMVITYKGTAIEAPFFAISAGKTRDGKEILGSKEYPYLQSVSCDRDFLAQEYLQTFFFSWETLSERLGAAKEDVQEIQVKETDSADYAMQIKIKDKIYSGEEFRVLLTLPSANMQIKIEEKGVTITTKGLGHGLGFSQYGANLLAVEGEDFVELLGYFYTNIQIEKM